MSDSLTFMRSLDERYRQVSGLTERRHYSIFYSKVIPSSILVLGYNPAGDPENWDESRLASRSFYENYEHEYVDCHYPLAVAMRNFLTSVLDLEDVAGIRTIPKTNLIFRRSRGQDSLATRTSDALQEALPFVQEIIVRVQPRLILFEGAVTLDTFEANYCNGVARDVDDTSITTPNGRYPATIFRSDRAFVWCLGREVVLIGVGHPSKYAGRSEWADVVSRSRGVINDIGVSGRGLYEADHHG